MRCSVRRTKCAVRRTLTLADEMKRTIKHIAGVLGCSILCAIVLYVSFTWYLSGDHRRPSTTSAQLRTDVGSAIFNAYLALPTMMTRIGHHDTSALHGDADRASNRMLISVVTSTILYGTILYGCIRMLVGRRQKAANKGLVRTGDPRTARLSAQP